jgi:hypothetical protein
MTEPHRFSIKVYGRQCRIRTCAPELEGMGTKHYEAPEVRTEP